MQTVPAETCSDKHMILYAAFDHNLRLLNLVFHSTIKIMFYYYSLVLMIVFLRI